jgi:hypothetical protein
MSGLTLYGFQLGIRNDVYIVMPADLDQFGRNRSHGTLVGGESLIELRHHAAHGG